MAAAAQKAPANEIADLVATLAGRQSSAGFTQPSAIVPPRVFRFGASIQF